LIIVLQGRAAAKLLTCDEARRIVVTDLENTLTLIKLDPAENVPLLAPLLDMPLPKERVLLL
jgi:hypothetical protein